MTKSTEASESVSDAEDADGGAAAASGVLGGCRGAPGGVNGSWEKASPFPVVTWRRSLSLRVATCLMDRLECIHIKSFTLK